jgi:hypothetical protein
MGYYAAKDFFEDEKLVEFVTAILSGNLTLSWYDPGTTRVKARPADPGRGLTYADCNLGPYGYDDIPELVRNRNSMAARGSALPAGSRPRLPDQPQERRVVRQRRSPLRGGQGAPLGARGRRRVE